MESSPPVFYSKDLNFKKLNIPGSNAAQGVDGSIFSFYKGVIYKLDPGAGKPIELAKLVLKEYCPVFAFDHAGNLFCAPHRYGQLLVSRNGGQSFETSLENGPDGHFRGFAIDNRGGIFTGSYYRHGPACLFYSADEGKSWTDIKTFRCRHIHDVGVNPLNNWLYVVTGEFAGAHFLDAYRVFRSKDGGKTWSVIVEPANITPWGRARPLYLGIGFLGDKVLISSDHGEGSNWIASFTDKGEDMIFPVKRVLDVPADLLKQNAHASMFWRFVSWNGSVYSWVCGNTRSALFRSANGDDWEICAIFPGMAGHNPEFYPHADKLLFSNDGFIWQITEKKEDHFRLRVIGGSESRLSALLKYDRRFKDEFSGGYYARSLEPQQRIQLAIKKLTASRLPPDALIADAGCGIGPFLIAARAAGYINVVGIEANPRWLHALRHIYEREWPDESPQLRLVPHGDFMLPNMSQLWDAIFILGVFVGDGNRIAFSQAIETSHRYIKAGGILCLNVTPISYGKKGPETFIEILARLAFKEIRCEPISKGNFFISAIKGSADLP